MTIYNVEKDFSHAKVSTAIKTDVTAALIEFLREKYGEAAQIRTGNSSGTASPVNEIGFSAGIVNEDGETFTAYVSINPTVKPWKERPYGKGVRKAFSFAAAAQKFADWVAENERKAQELAEKKAKKIAADKAAREKARAEKEAKKAEAGE